MNHRFLAPLCAVAFAACSSNYDFAKAKLPNGEWDIAKLTADLNASGEKELQDFFWIPLIHMRTTSFGPSSAEYPTGYRLNDISAYAPLFFGISMDQRYVDGKGELVESQQASTVGWGLFYNSQLEQIATQHGTRTVKGMHVLLFFGGKTKLEYVDPAQKAQ
jgi:hypothetical protein